MWMVPRPSRTGSIVPPASVLGVLPKSLQNFLHQEITNTCHTRQLRGIKARRSRSWIPRRHSNGYQKETSPTLFSRQGRLRPHHKRNTPYPALPQGHCLRAPNRPESSVILGAGINFGRSELFSAKVVLKLPLKPSSVVVLISS
jgi:hypothetical protein